MYPGLTARMDVPELGSVIPGLWQSPFHFTDEIWLRWYSDGVILTPTKRGLSQPPEALRGAATAERGHVSQSEGDFREGLSVGKCEWMAQVYWKLKKCLGREHACLHKPCLAYRLPARLPVSTAHPCSNGAAQWLTVKLHVGLIQLPGAMCLTVLGKKAFCALWISKTEGKWCFCVLPCSPQQPQKVTCSKTWHHKLFVMNSAETITEVNGCHFESNLGVFTAPLWATPIWHTSRPSLLE